jgi:spermidine synthase
LLTTLYFLSGFCSLVYETVWIRKFSLIFGSTIFATTIVVAVFFAGLALGSSLFASIATRSKNPVGLYALLEVVIGAYALAFPIFLVGAQYVYSLSYPALHESFALLFFVRGLVAVAVLIVPTVAMGGTLPILTKHFIRRLDTAGRRSGLIYGANTLGAALGSFFAGYLLLQTLGASGTNLLAALINVAIGVLALTVSAQSEVGARSDSAPSRPKALRKKKAAINTDRSITVVIVCFALSGFVSMAYEIVWLRYLSIFARDTIYLYTGIIGAFILAMGTGSLFGGWWVDRRREPTTIFGLLQAAIGVSTIGMLYLAANWHHTIYAAGEKGGSEVLPILFALLFIPAVLMGATFPVVTKIIATDVPSVGRRVGKAYASNVAGSIAGLLAAGFFMFPSLGLQGAVYILFGMNMVLASILLLADGNPMARRWSPVPPALAAVVLLFIIYGPGKKLMDIVLPKTLGPSEAIVEVREGVTGMSWATRSEDYGVVLWDNGTAISKELASFQNQGFIPLLIAPHIPRSVLGLAFGGGLSYYASGLFPEIEKIDFVDISRENIEVALKHFSENEWIGNDARTRFFIDDAYSFLKYTENTYDLILMEPTPPMLSFRNAALYTKEFYELAGNRLTEVGLFGQVLPLGNMSDIETRSVVRTFSSVFTQCLLWWNGFDTVMIGSNREFKLNLEEIQKRLSRPTVRTSLEKYSEGVDYHRIDNFIAGLLLTTKGFKRVAAGGTVYTDDLCELEFSTGMHVTLENMRWIHANQSPWAEVKGLLAKVHGANLDKDRVLAWREYLFGILYDWAE